MPSLPQETRTYQNHHLDSTRWRRYTARDGDVIISTSLKSGTTWMQAIVARLLLPDGELSGALTDTSPWIDARVIPEDPLFAAIDAQTHRRFFKSHLPLDGLPYSPEVRYIVVGRDARDAFMSLWNHYSNYTPTAYAIANDTPGRVGDPLPACEGDLRAFWRLWMSRGWFAWEQDGWPFLSHLHHAQTWWEWRHLPNVLLVHYNDLLADLPGELRRVAAHLGVDLPEERLMQIARAVSFPAMKERSASLMPMADLIWACGSAALVNQGSNGRWRDVLTDDDLALHAAAVARTLTPDCAAWLEGGRAAGSMP